jgi:hypothetical protein
VEDGVVVRVPIEKLDERLEVAPPAAALLALVDTR